jgi:hypothetical protein
MQLPTKIIHTLGVTLDGVTPSAVFAQVVAFNSAFGKFYDVF